MGTRTKRPARKSGWRQWTAGEAREVLAAWKRSGLPLATFARRRGLSAERVRWWRQRLGDWRGGGEERARLVPVVVTDAARDQSAGASGMVRVHAPGGVVVEITAVEAVPASWVSALVLGLARPAA